MQELSVTVSFRERIALPPGAQLDVQVADVGEAERQGGPIASQRFAMAAVPMTVSLTYDRQVVKDGSQYVLLAAIRGPDGRLIFRGRGPLESFGGSETAAVDLLLTMLPAADMNAAVPRRISGVPWSVTEVFGEAWQNDDPATFVIDDEMNFAIFGGCNRFSGQVAPTGDALAFPENMAGTLMACPEAVEGAEQRFLGALRQVSGYVRYGAGLVMIDTDGRAVLHFVETPE
jgi:putative lipoprotein